jgi:hypothetical protein
MASSNNSSSAVQSVVVRVHLMLIHFAHLTNMSDACDAVVMPPCSWTNAHQYLLASQNNSVVHEAWVSQHGAITTLIHTIALSDDTRQALSVLLCDVNRESTRDAAVTKILATGIGTTTTSA